jgi:DNA-binding GntR family transcriptional regulator
MILRGDLHPGARLVELDIATQMGTSQGPVREALHRLERDGLVERRSRVGTFVTPMMLDEMRELFEVRSMIEQFAIRRAITRISAEQIDELEGHVQRMRAAGTANDMIAVVDCDMEFHRCICTWAEQSTLLRAWLPLFMQVQRFIVQVHPHYYPDLTEMADAHQPILDALRSNSVELAEHAIGSHIMSIWSRMPVSQQPLDA